MATRGGVHSTLTLASALALASHSAFALGGSMSPSQRPLHSAIAFALALQDACAEPSHLAPPGVVLHEPSHLPEHLPLASTAASQLPLHMPSHLPEHLAAPLPSLT